MLSIVSLFGLEKNCEVSKERFLKEERAYTMVVSVAIAGTHSYEIIERFIKEGNAILKECPKTFSLDRQYTLKRALKKAVHLKKSYKVMTQAQVKSYAISHPEEIVVYKWGTIRPVR